MNCRLTLVILATAVGSAYGDDPFGPAVFSDAGTVGDALSTFDEATPEEPNATTPPRGVSSKTGDPVRIRVEVVENSYRTVTLPRPAKTLYHSRDNAEAAVVDEKRVRVKGVSRGMDTVLVGLADGGVAEIEVLVRADTREVDDLLKRLYPNATIETHVAGSALLLRGKVENAEHVNQVVEIGEQFFPVVLNQLTVAGPPRPAGGANPFGVTSPNYGTSRDKLEPGTPEFERAMREMNAMLEQQRWNEARVIASRLLTHRDANIEDYIRWRQETEGDGPRIPAGMRVVSISVGSSGVHRLLKPGDHVDVGATLRARAEGEPVTRTANVLENVRIFAVDSRTDDAKRTVSLLVTPEQTQTLKLAENTGTLHVTLRGHGDDEPSGALDEPSTDDDPFSLNSTQRPRSVATEIRELRNEVRSLRKDVARILELLDETDEGSDGEPRSATEADEEAARRVDRDLLGLGMMPVPANEWPEGTRFRGGMAILEVLPGGRADRAGFRKGDYLVGIDAWEIATVENLDFVLERLDERGDRGDEHVKVYLIRKRDRGGWETLFAKLDLARLNKDARRRGTTELTAPATDASLSRPVRVAPGETRRITFHDDVIVGVVNRKELVARATLEKSGDVVVKGIGEGRAVIEVWTGRNGKEQRMVDVVVEADAPTDDTDPTEAARSRGSLFRDVPGISVDTDSPGVPLR